MTCHFYENGIELTCSGDNELFCPQMQVKKVYFFFFFLQSFISLAHNTYISHYTTLSLLHFKKQIYLTYILNPPIPYPHPAIQCKQRRKRKGYYDDSKIIHFSLKLHYRLVSVHLQANRLDCLCCCSCLCGFDDDFNVYLVSL